ncbi:MAG: hypothetical protein WCO92_02350 [Verrucomicrobiota bacterium]
MTHDAKKVQEGEGKPVPLKREDSSASETDYGELENEEFDEERKDVLLELQEATHPEEPDVNKPPVLRITFLKDQRPPSQRHLAMEASGPILAREASYRAAVEVANIDKDCLPKTVGEGLSLGEPIAAVESVIVRPPADLYSKLPEKEQCKLDKGNIIVTETKGESCKSYRMTYYKPSTFTAYYLFYADERKAADFYWDPARATKIFPKCTEVQVTKSLPRSTAANYIFQVDANIPVILGRWYDYLDVLRNKKDRRDLEE